MTMQEKRVQLYPGFFVDHSSLPKSEIQHLVFTDIEDPRCRSLEKEEVFNVFDTDDEGGIFECYDVTSKTAYICSESGLFEMPAGSQFWFEPVRQVETIEGLDRIDTNQVKSMEGMFYDCNKLKDLDLTHWSTGKVENMSRMFAECSSLTRLNLNGWNVENVTDMFQMFSNCSSLKALSVDAWNTANVSEMSQTFHGCRSITDTSFCSWWNTENVLSMDHMFSACISLKEACLPGFDTSKVVSMRNMFRSCVALERINLSGASTPQSPDLDSIFKNCVSLKEFILPRHPMQARSLKKAAKERIQKNQERQASKKEDKNL